jgi:ribose 5-phosphate isomerase B
MEPDVVDFSVHTLNPDDDYPDYVVPLARAVVAGTSNACGVCGSGVSASVCANKIPGVRAGLGGDRFWARQGAEEQATNVTVLFNLINNSINEKIRRTI